MISAEKGWFPIRNSVEWAKKEEPPYRYTVSESGLLFRLRNLLIISKVLLTIKNLHLNCECVKVSKKHIFQNLATLFEKSPGNFNQVSYGPPFLKIHHYEPHRIRKIHQKLYRNNIFFYLKGWEQEEFKCVLKGYLHWNIRIVE